MIELDFLGSVVSVKVTTWMLISTTAIWTRISGDILQTDCLTRESVILYGRCNVVRVNICTAQCTYQHPAAPVPELSGCARYLTCSMLAAVSHHSDELLIDMIR